MSYIPGITISLLFALLIGFIFHFWKGGGILRLFFILVFSVIGFGIGQWVGVSMDSNFLKIGWVFLGFGVLGSILFSFIAIWLTNIRLEKQDKK
jgi:hypothetical protein